VKFFLKCRNHPIKCYQCVMHSQGRAGAQNAQWTHRWDSGSRVVLGSDRDNKGGWKCWSAQVAIMAMISTPSWNRPPLSVGRQLYLGFFLASLAMFVLTKVRGVSENRIKGRQIGAFCCCCCCYCSIILLSAGQQQEAAICIQFWHLPLSYPRLPVWLLKFWCGA